MTTSTSHSYTTEDGGRLNNFAIEPRMYVDEGSSLGFTEEAEKANGRAAMIGFVILLACELFTGQSFLSWLSNLSA
jgi:hypothetical protein